MNTGVASAGLTERPTSSWMEWTGRVLSGAVTLLMVGGGVANFFPRPEAAEMTRKFGFEASIGPVLGALMISCGLLYAIPRTRVLGAILLTGYLGGAVATHVRVHDPFFMPLAVGIVVWLGLFLRDQRIRSLVPLTRPS
jgi:hypothetical protein